MTLRFRTNMKIKIFLVNAVYCKTRNYCAIRFKLDRWNVDNFFIDYMSYNLKNIHLERYLEWGNRNRPPTEIWWSGVFNTWLYRRGRKERKRYLVFILELSLNMFSFDISFEIFTLVVIAMLTLENDDMSVFIFLFYFHHLKYLELFNAIIARSKL